MMQDENAKAVKVGIFKDHFSRTVLRVSFTLMLASIFSVASALCEDRCRRIVSLAPSITEALFSLGLGDRIVGVSRFCAYPPEVRTLPQVGGLFDPNYEAIVKLQPSVAMYLSEFRERAEALTKLSVSSLVLDQRTVPGILGSIESIGIYCGVEDSAKHLVSELQRELAMTKAITSQETPVRTLVVVGSEEVGNLKGLYVSGSDGFYDALVTAAGGINVVQGETKSVTALSLEAIAALRPEVIIEIHPDIKDPVAGRKKALQAWQSFPFIPAVRNERLYVIGKDYSYIPGPRFPKLLADFVTFLHPKPGSTTSHDT